jgi:hypothetical protein
MIAIHTYHNYVLFLSLIHIIFAWVHILAIFWHLGLHVIIIIIFIFN